MEKRKIAWMILTAITISLVIVAGSLTVSMRQERSAAQEVTTEETTTEPGYLLKIADGQIGLFRMGSSVPYQRLDMPLNLLSDYDREQLEEGIPAATETELRQLVEDLTS